MTRLPEGTILGQLKLVETYVYYDAPRVFSCERVSGQRYITEWIGELEDDDADEWLYVPVSHDRFLHIRSGGITLRRAFVDPEDLVFHVVTYYDDRADAVRIVDPASLPDEWLPTVDFSLDLPTSTLPAASSAEEMRQKAIAESRTRLRLELKTQSQYRSEANTRDIGRLLTGLQQLIDNIGFSLEFGEDVYGKGPIPAAITKQTESEVVDLRAASFVIELAAATYDDLLGDSLFAKASERMLQVLDINLDRVQITEEVSSLGPRAAKSLRKFVETALASDSSLGISAAGANLGFRSQTLSEERIAFLATLLKNIDPDEEVSVVTGEMELTAYDSNSFTFGLRDDQGAEYDGRVEEQARAHIVKPTINERYRVILAVLAVFDEVIGETKTRYRLRQLVPVQAD